MIAENLNFFKATYSNYPSPPPFLYHYTISINIEEKGENHLTFELKYLERDELDEDEIIEEGFTLNDDYYWEGSLPEAWINEIKKLLQATKDSGDKEHVGNNIEIEFEAGGNKNKLIPANFDKWEYLLQELVQAVFELSRKENPLEIQYKEIQPGKKDLDISLIASFALRKAEVRKNADHKEKVKELPWSSLKDLLALIYQPDYDYEQASGSKPHKPGKYLSTGEGLWFRFGKTITNPEKTNDVLKKIEETFKNMN